MNLRRSLPALLPLVIAASFVAVGTAESGTPKQSPVNVTPGSIRLDPHAPKLDVTYGSSALELKYIRKDAADPNGCTTRNHEETEEAEVQPQADGSALVSGLAHVEELERAFGVEIGDRDFDTVGGLVTASLGRVPEKGETLDARGLAIEVLEADPRRVYRVRVRKAGRRPAP